MRLFGQDFIDYGKYGVIGTPLLIHGRYGRRFRNSDVRFQITASNCSRRPRVSLSTE